MNLKEYQKFTESTAKYPGRGQFIGLLYLILKFNEESGEATGKMGKLMRDESVGVLFDHFGKGDWLELKRELGDIFWYFTEIANHFGFSLEDILETNVIKLKDRLARNVIKGSGDNR